MGNMSRVKGSRAEREVCSLAGEFGFVADRTRSGDGQPLADIVGISGCVVEVKRRKRISLADVEGWLWALCCLVDSGDADRRSWPVVAHRQDRGPWLASLPMVDWLDITLSVLPHDRWDAVVTVPLDTLLSVLAERGRA